MPLLVPCDNMKGLFSLLLDLKEGTDEMKTNINELTS